MRDRSERASNRSKEAKQLADEAFKNASKTFEILKNFDSSLNAQKERATDAKKLEDTITKSVDEARATYFNLTSRLDNARADLTQAATSAAFMNQQIGSANKVIF